MNAQTNFLQQYATDVRNIIREMESWGHLSHEKLQLQPNAGQWSVAQCVQHMNVYSRYYLPTIEAALNRAQATPGSAIQSGLLGKYFIQLMKLDEHGRVTKSMKSPKNAIPVLLPNVEEEISEFIQHQHQLLNLLHRAQNTDINQIRIPTSIMKMIRMRLGDTFAFFIEHEKRHMAQGRKALKGDPEVGL
ncbi:MAG: DinB family protein [Flavobacteriales bacterium]|nr:DinB family protein [Flavobacteriales bacterium]